MNKTVYYSLFLYNTLTEPNFIIEVNQKMHDSFLLHRLAASLQRICDENRLRNIKEMVIDVSTDSHITAEDLKEHLIEIIPELINKDTEINIRKTALEEQNAIIYMLKGDSLEG